MEFNSHTSYKQARTLSSLVWNISRRWDKSTLSLMGYQLIRAVDSISANIAEGWNRYYKKDKIHFFIIARGSLSESKDWTEKAFERSLITEYEFKSMIELIDKILIDINGLIKGTNQNLKK